MPSVQDRLNASIDIRDCGYATPCWHWTACINRYGYGKLSVGGKMRLAHRVAYELLIGSIPENLQIDHLCRNRACVNPAHMEPVTPLENMRRGVQAQKTHCARGHEYDAGNTYRRPDGRRDCRACIRERVRRYAARRRTSA